MKEILITITILILSYILGHLIRYLTKFKFCAKCFSLTLTLIILSFFNSNYLYPYLFLWGALTTILAYYLDDYLMNTKKINVIAQDFLILLGLFSIAISIFEMIHYFLVT